MLLKNTTSVVLFPPSVELVDLRVQNGTITERKKNLTAKRGEDVYDMNGRIVMPGFVCSHTHLYSSLTRGMPGPKQRPQNFLEILDFVWWKLDRALDDETIYYSALVGAIDAVRCGATTIVDHHASPSVIKGSLDTIKEAMEEVGLRGVLCYEVTDRGGKKERDQGIRENERFIQSNKKNRMFRGIVGAHAAFTLCNDSLRRCGELAADCRTGVHIHVAEDTSDVIDARENYRCSIIDRLEESGCLNERSILSHCVHLSPDELRRVRQAKSWMVHNPRSNMNNRIGYAPVHLFGDRAALGTDGFPTDMFEEARSGFFKMRDSKSENVDVVKLLQNGQNMISEIFGQKFGTLAKGSVADLVVLDYQSPTPSTVDNVAGHFLFGMQSSMVESVMIEGKWVVKNRVVVGVDLPSVYEKSQRAAKKLWEKME